MSNRLDTTRIERHVTIDVHPSYRKRIYKTLRKISASDHERRLQIMSNRLESNDLSQLMSTRHTEKGFARHFENFPRVTTKGGCK